MASSWTHHAVNWVLLQGIKLSYLNFSPPWLTRRFEEDIFTAHHIVQSWRTRESEDPPIIKLIVWCSAGLAESHVDLCVWAWYREICCPLHSPNATKNKHGLCCHYTVKVPDSEPGMCPSKGQEKSPPATTNVFFIIVVLPRCYYDAGALNIMLMVKKVTM